MLGGHSDTIIIVVSILLALSLVTVSLRCYVRIRMVKAFGWDDRLMVLAMFFDLAFAICRIVGAAYGMGRKKTYFQTRPSDFRTAMICWWLAQIFYILTTTVMRQSIVIMLFRFTMERVHIVILYGASILSFVIGVIFFFFAVFQCSPINYYWDRLTVPGQCIDFDVLISILYFYSASAALCDLTIGLLPAFLIRHLRVSRRTKIAVAGILGIGCIASAAVIIRIPFLETLKSDDALYATTQLAMLSHVEASLGIIAGSLAPIRPLLRRMANAISSMRGKVITACERLPDSRQET